MQGLQWATENVFTTNREKKIKTVLLTIQNKVPTATQLQLFQLLLTKFKRMCALMTKLSINTQDAASPFWANFQGR
jgi:hypothetical protein